MSEHHESPNEPLAVIGHIHTPFKDFDKLPIQGTANDARGTIALLPAYQEGLADLEGFDRVWLIFLNRPPRRPQMKIIPRLDEKPRGVFATRSPYHPNPIGITCVRLLSMSGCTLQVSGVDMLDDTELLDIKPYVPRYDSYPEAWAGWLESRIPPERGWHEQKKHRPTQ